MANSLIRRIASAGGGHACGFVYRLARTQLCTDAVKKLIVYLYVVEAEILERKMKQVLIAAYVGKRNEYKYRGMSNICWTKTVKLFIVNLSFCWTEYEASLGTGEG